MLLLSGVWLLINGLSELLGRAVSVAVNRTPAILFAVAILSLFLLNQHRLQPWAWQSLLYAALIAIARTPKEVVFSARWLTASIYFYSAVSKFDYQFIYGLGGRLAEALTETIGIQSNVWLKVTALAMPIFELLIAVLLLATPKRRVGVLLAAVFHGALVLTLGPWGLNHHTGVLVWNIFFFLITASLFWPGFSPRQKFDAVTSDCLLRRSGVLILTAALVFYPLLPQVDHWLAWGLYSPNNSRCDLEVIRAKIDGDDDSAGGIVFERVDLGALSLQQLNVPLYPEARFQLGVATAIQRQQEFATGSRIKIRSRSDRFTGKRQSVTYRQDGGWSEEKQTFFWNWRPRSILIPEPLANTRVP